MAEADKKNNNHSHIFGESGNHRENGRTRMARKNRVASGLFTVAALVAFGLASESLNAAEMDWVVHQDTSTPNFNNTAPNFYRSENGTNLFPVASSADTVNFTDSVRIVDGAYDVTPRKDVNVDGSSVSVYNMNVKGTGYTFDGSGATIYGGNKLEITGNNTTFATRLNFDNATIGSSSKSVTATMGNYIYFNELTVNAGSTLNIKKTSNTNVMTLKGGGTITKYGNGTGDLLYLTKGSDTFNGNLVINEGDLIFDKDASLAIGNIKLATGTTFDMSAATLTDSVTTVGKLWGNGTVSLGANKLVLKGTEGFTGKISSEGPTSGVYNGGGVEVQGTTTFSAAQNYDGMTTITSGSLNLSGVSNVEKSKGVEVNGGTFSIAGNDNNVAVNTFTGTGGNVDLGNRTLTIKKGFDPVTESGEAYSGVIRNSSGTNTGTGGVTVNLASATEYTALKGENTYLGATTITKGTLKLQGTAANGAIASSSGVTIESNGVLELAKADGTSATATKSAVKKLSDGSGPSNAGKILIDQYNALKLISDGTTMGSFSGTIEGDGGIEIASTSANAKFILSSDASKVKYEGDTTITTGTLELGSGSKIGSDGLLSIGESGVFDVSAASTTGYSVANRVSATSTEAKIIADKGITFSNGGTYNGKLVRKDGTTTLYDVNINNGARTTINTDEKAAKTLSFNGRNDVGRMKVYASSLLNLGSDAHLVYGADVHGEVTSYGTIEDQANVFEGARVFSGGKLTSHGTIEDGAVVTTGGTLISTNAIKGGVTVTDGKFVGSGTVDGNVTISGSSGVFENTRASGSTTNSLTITNGGYSQTNGTINLDTFVTGTNYANVSADYGVNLGSAALNVKTDGVVGDYVLFQGSSVTGLDLSKVHVTKTGTINTQDNYTVRVVDGNKLVLTVLSGNKNEQYWRGSSGNSIWDSTTTNWTASNSPTDANRDIWKSHGSAGGVATFDSAAGASPITVAGTQNFDTIKILESDRTFTGDNLRFAPASGGNDATVQVGEGRTVIFNNQLTDGGDTYGLLVTGGGRVVLGVKNTYDGGTTISGSTELELRNNEAAGSSTITFSNTNGTLILGSTENSSRQSYEFKNQIISSGSTSGNKVKIADGKDVTLNNSGNLYYAETVVGKNAKLTSGTGSLSKNSFHTLEENATLDVRNGKQEIAGFGGSESSKIDITSSLYVYHNGTGSSAIDYAGTLNGSGDFVSAGTGDIILERANNGNFSGAYKVNSGTLTLRGIANKDMNVKIGGYDTTADGTVRIEAENNSVIKLSEDNSNTFNGTVEIGKGTFVMDSSAEALLNNYGSTLVLDNDGVMNVDKDYSINSLTLDGGIVNLHNESGTMPGGSAPYLKTESLYVADNTNIFVDTGDFENNVNNQNFFDLDNGVRKTIIESATIPTGTSNVDIYDYASKRLISDAQPFNLTRDGEINGIAVVDMDSGVNDNNSNGSYGVFYSQELASIEALAGTLPVRIDSSGSSIKGDQTMNALLTGQGDFEFVGNTNITLADNKGKGENDYTGRTIVNMGSTARGVYAGTDKAFGDTSELDIQQGTVFVNGKNLEVGAVSGQSTGKINFNAIGSDLVGGNLTIRDQGDSPALAAFAGAVTGNGNIIMESDNAQVFSGANRLFGTITQKNGDFTWAGTVTNTGTGASPAVAVTGGTFRQDNSRIVGNASVSNNGTIAGYGTIQGDLNIATGGTYLVTMSNDKNALDTTKVTGAATFGDGTNFEFDNSAMSYMLKNRGATNQTIIDAKTLDINAGNKWYKDGVITYNNMGFLGTVKVATNGGDLVYQGIDAPLNPTDSIKTSWNDDGIQVHDIIDRSNLGDVAYDTFVKYLYQDSSPIITNSVINARFANAKIVGHAFTTGSYNKKDVLSMMNYDSGYTATLPVQAALDTARTFVGQGLKNRVNNLRAARTIMGEAFGFGGYPGYGYGSYMQPTGAYGSNIVQDTFGYNVPGYAPGYMGTEYFGPYSGQPVAAGYGFAQQQQPVYGYGQPYVPGWKSTNIWAGGIGNWNKQKTSDGGIGGYTYDAGGVMVGADHIAGNFVFGAALGYSHGKLEDKEAIWSDSKIKAYSANLYADYNHESGINTMLFGGYTWYDNDIRRTVAGYRDEGGTIKPDYGTERSDYKGHAWYVGGNLSYDWIPADRLTVTPSIGVEYYDARGKSHERDLVRNSGVTLKDKVSSIHGRSLSAPIDVNVTYDVVKRFDTKLSVMGNVGYSYEFHNKGPKGSLNWMDVSDSPTVYIAGRKPGRSGFNLGAGARFQKKCLSFDVKYDYFHRKDNTSHRVAANVGWEF